MGKNSKNEVSIAFKSARNSFIFAEAFLLVWVILSVVIGDKLSILPLVLLILNAFVFFGSQYYYHNYKGFKRISENRRLPEKSSREE